MCDVKSRCYALEILVEIRIVPVIEEYVSVPTVTVNYCHSSYRFRQSIFIGPSIFLSESFVTFTGMGY